MVEVVGLEVLLVKIQLDLQILVAVVVQLEATVELVRKVAQVL